MAYRLLLAALCILSGGALGCASFRDCSALTSVARFSARPSDLGSLAEPRSTSSDQVIGYRPNFPLWSDGATKRRWLSLPRGTQINTRVETSWIFPRGAKLYKEFTRDGVRVETRVLERTPQGWSAMAYQWRNGKARPIPAGLKNASNTPHDIPSAGECSACHGGRKSMVLGFSATQLTPAFREDLHANGLLSHPSTGSQALDSVDRAALGYLHANCSHCHNAERKRSDVGCFDPGFDFDFSLPPSLEDRRLAPALQTGSDVLGDFERSLVLERMTERNDSSLTPSMPPLGTELVDTEAVEALRAFLARSE